MPPAPTVEAPSELAALQDRLGYQFANIELLRKALTHTSHANEAIDPRPESNERLEFLGDAALELIVADALYRAHSDVSEGELTAMRSAVVRLDTLGRVGLVLGIGDHILIGRGEEATGGRHRGTIIGRALEAIIGAIYLDGGVEAARGASMRVLADEMRRLDETRALKDDRSRLQEAAQSEFGLTPSYRMVAAVGPDHAKEFSVEVSIGEGIVGRGVGRTKQQASQRAAHDALGRWPPDVKVTRGR